MQTNNETVKQTERKKYIHKYKLKCYFSHLIFYAMHQQFLNVMLDIWYEWLKHTAGRRKTNKQSYGQLDKQKERKKYIQTYKQKCYFSHLLLYTMHQQVLNVMLDIWYGWLEHTAGSIKTNKQSYGQLDKQKSRNKYIQTYKQKCFFSHLLLYTMQQQFLNVTIGLWYGWLKHTAGSRKKNSQMGN
jgi:hypothetical protein